MKNALGLVVFAAISSSSLVALAQDLPPVDSEGSADAGRDLPPPPAEPTLMVPPMPPPPPPPRLLLDKKLRGVELAGDLTYAASQSNAITHGSGYASDVRVGYRFAVGDDVFLAPGVDVGYVDFPRFDGAMRVGIGGRVGVAAGILEPSIFAYGGGFLNPFKSGLGVRAGGALDLRVGRWFVPGIHVEGDAASWDTNSIRYLGIGAHAGFLF